MRNYQQASIATVNFVHAYGGCLEMGEGSFYWIDESQLTAAEPWQRQMEISKSCDLNCLNLEGLAESP
jgi:hypothetical protein